MTPTSDHPVPTNPIRRHDLYTLALILLVAAIMRMGDLARVTEFQYDAATLSILALDMLHGEEFPLLGIPSSAGIPNSPATIYFIALPYLFTDNPQFVTLFIAAFNVVGVGLLWFMAHRYFNPIVALVAGFAYALHPFAVHYSRAIWAQDYHTPLILLGFLLALYGFVEGKRWAQIAGLPIFLFAVQIHYAAWTLLPAYAWIVWMGRKHLSGRAVALSIILGILTLVPFGLGLATQAGGSATASAEGVISRLDSLVIRDKAPIYAVRLATGLGGPWVGTPTVGDVSAWVWFPYPTSFLWLSVGASVALGLISVFLKRSRQWGVLLWLWAVVPIAVFVPNWTGVFPHYFVPNLAVFALLTGIGMTWLLAKLPDQPLLKRLTLTVFGLVLLTQGAQYLSFLRAVDTTPMNQDLHPLPLHYLLDVRAALANYDDVVIAGGVPKRSGYDVFKALLYNTATCLRELAIETGGVAVFPAGRFAVVTPPGALGAATGDLYRSESSLTIPLRAGEPSYVIDPFDAAPAWNGAALVDLAPSRFDNGVTLTGYLLESGRVYLRWQLPGNPTQGGYKYFAHFLDSRGEKIGQQDAGFWPARFWCEGDTLITWVDAAVPEGTHTLRIGLYRMENDNFVNSNVLDAVGNPVGLWVDINTNSVKHDF